MERNEIIYIYDRIDFFGNREYTQDSAYLTRQNLKKALAALKRDRNSAVHLAYKDLNLFVVLAWDRLTEYENGILLVRVYDRSNSYDDNKMAFENGKKYVYGLLEELGKVTAAA